MRSKEELAEEYAMTRFPCKEFKNYYNWRMVCEEHSQSYLAGYEAATSRWVKFDPEDMRTWPMQIGCGGPYLTYVDNTQPYFNGASDHHFDARETVKWSSNAGMYVTHWMPLPEFEEEG